MMINRKITIFVCLVITLLTAAVSIHTQQPQNKRAEIRNDFVKLTHYLELDGKVSRQEIDKLTDLKLKAISATASKTERETAYNELFHLIYRLQGNTAPQESVEIALTDYAKTAAGFPPNSTAETSGWATTTTPLGKLGAIKKMGNGPIPLILIPNQEGWDLYKSFMEQHLDKFTMYAITLPGFGGSPPPPNPEFMDYTKLGWWRNAEQAIVNLINDEKIEKPVIAGVMYGAYLAGRIALNHPDKIRGAVMINGLVYANDRMPFAERQKQAKQGIAAFPSTELIPWSRRPPIDAVRKAIESNPQALARIQNWAKDSETAKTLVINATTNNHPTVARYGSELLTTDLTEDLKNLKVPTLVIPALSDPDSPYQGKIALTQFEEIKTKYPAIPMTIKPFENVRQYVLFEAGEKLGNEIEAFFSEKKQTENQIPPEAQKRLDHHIGKWNIKMDYFDANGKVVYSTTGTDEARYLIDKRVVEMTTNIPDLPSFSKAWIFYSISDKTFYVTSVDEKGEFWVMSGGLDKYVITSKPKRQADGSEIIIRFTHSNIKEDSFEALMEYSKDKGKTWKAGFKQYLTRQKIDIRRFK